MYEAHELVSVLPTDQVFSVRHIPTGETIYINIGLLQRLRKAAPHCFRLIKMDITPEIYDFFVKRRGVEEEHLARLQGAQLRDPGLGIFGEDGSFTLVDGHHRAVRRYRGGIKWIKVFVTVPQIWRQVCLNVDKGSELELALTRDLAPDDGTWPSHIQGTVSWNTDK